MRGGWSERLDGTCHPCRRFVLLPIFPVAHSGSPLLPTAQRHQRPHTFDDTERPRAGQETVDRGRHACGREEKDKRSTSLFERSECRQPIHRDSLQMSRHLTPNLALPNACRSPAPRAAGPREPERPSARASEWSALLGVASLTNEHLNAPEPTPSRSMRKPLRHTRS